MRVTIGSSVLARFLRPLLTHARQTWADNVEMKMSKPHKWAGCCFADDADDHPEIGLGVLDWSLVCLYAYRLDEAHPELDAIQPFSIPFPRQ